MTETTFGARSAIDAKDGATPSAPAQTTQVQLVDFGRNMVVGTLQVNGALPVAILLDGNAVYLRGEKDRSVYAMASTLIFYSTDFTNV